MFMKKMSDTIFILSWVVVVLTAVSSASGLFWSETYKYETVRLAMTMKGQDFVTLFIVIPICICSMLSARKGNVRGMLSWLGVLAYLVYQNLLYSLATAFNVLYFIYILTFSMSIAIFISVSLSMDFVYIRRQFTKRFPIWITGVYELTMAMMLALLWISNIIERYSHGLMGRVNPELCYWQIMEALDIGLIVPLCFLAGSLLLQKKPVGFYLTGIVLMKGSTLLLGFGATLIALRIKGIETDINQELFVSMGIFFGLYLFYKFFKAIKPASS